MNSLEDEDGIDGPFERAMKRAEKEDKSGRGAARKPTGSRPSPVEQSPTYRNAMRDAGRGHLLP